MKRRPFVAGNWKMHGSLEMTAELATGVAEGAGRWTQIDVAICPPYPYLTGALDAVNGRIAVGAQDVSEQAEQGAYTGEVNGNMLRDIGCSHVIVGHSERRAYYGENNEIVARKTEAALAAGLTPLVCIGETLEQRESGKMEAVLSAQLDAVIEVIGVAALENAVLAYEPVWAIGTGKTASPQQAQEVHAFLRQRIAGHDAIIAAALRILYGGSVKPDNAAELFSCGDVDGGLIGGAALDANGFAAICDAAQAKASA